MVRERARLVEGDDEATTRQRIAATVAEWLPALAEAVGAKPPRRIPAWVGRLLAGPVVATMITEARGASNAKAKRELGWQPRFASWRQGFTEGLG
jgi:2-alkyl-3-oxoalkanoate reductase